MLTSLHIQEFKGLRNVSIPELRKVNLILGGQNVGKTSLLEVVVFVAGDVDSSSSLLARSRLAEMFRPCEGNDSLRQWQALVGSPNKPIGVRVQAQIGEFSYIACTYEPVKHEGEKLVMRALNIDTPGLADWFMSSNDLGQSVPLGYVIPQPFPSFPKKAQEQVALYGELVMQRKKKELVQLLKKIEPRLESIEAAAPDGEHRVYAELLDHPVLLPLPQLGHGFTRLFELYAGLAVTESKLVLIDEIENGIHYSALPTLFEGVCELSESKGVQSIITTHSLEAIKAACDIFKDKPEDFQLIRLERTDDDNVRAIAINDENLKVVMASGWEMR